MKDIWSALPDQEVTLFADSKEKVIYAVIEKKFRQDLACNRGAK